MKTSGFHHFKSQLILVVLLGIIFHFFHVYDWGRPITKALCFTALIFLIVGIVVHSKDPAVDEKPRRFELVVYGLAAAAFLFYYGRAFLPEFLVRPVIDITSTTQTSATLFFRHHMNPYQSTTLAVYWDDPKFGGFHYGPFMFMGYGLSAYVDWGVKALNLLFVAVTFFLLAKLVAKDSAETYPLEGVLFFLLVAVLPERLWFELVYQGVIDILPVVLLVASLWFVNEKQWLWAGIMAGLSFSAKYVPAVFFILLFVRKDFKLPFFVGCAIGCVPLLAFAAWDFSAIFNNVFLFHTIKKYDSTSLYSVVPPSVHFVFPLIQLAATVFFVGRNFNKRINVKSLAVNYVLLMIILEMVYMEVHCNHLIWMLPFMAYIFASYRKAAAGLFGYGKENSLARA